MKTTKKRKPRQVTKEFTSLSKMMDSLMWHIRRGWRIDSIFDEHFSPSDAKYTIIFEK